MTTLTSQVPMEAPSGDRLALTLFLATVVHVLILLVTFGTEDAEPPDPTTPTLDITVVNPTKSLPPEDYDYLAESSQEGSGNTEEKVRPQQQLIEQAPPPATASEAEPTPAQVLTRDTSTRQTAQDEEVDAEQKPEQPSARELMNRSMEMLTLNEQINQSLQAYSKAPKSKYISARTKEFKYASYMRDWVSKVERVGELNYPDAARRGNLSGSLIVEVTILPDGTVRNITILRPSGHKLLDDAAVRIVKLASPFAPFSDDIRQETELLHITRTWVFTSGNRLQSR